MVCGFVVRTDGFPITGKLIHGIYIEFRLTRIAGKRIVKAVAARLGSAAGHGRERGINDVDSSINGSAAGINSVAGAFVRMQMNWQVDRVFQCGNQLVGCFRFQETGHVFNGNDISTRFFEFFGHGDIVIQIIFVTAWIQDITRVAESRFSNFIAAADGLDG